MNARKSLEPKFERTVRKLRSAGQRDVPRGWVDRVVVVQEARSHPHVRVAIHGGQTELQQCIPPDLGEDDAQRHLSAIGRRVDEDAVVPARSPVHMMTSVSPAARALMTMSRSPITTTSAIAGLATETRVTGTLVWMGYERPTGSAMRMMSLLGGLRVRHRGRRARKPGRRGSSARASGRRPRVDTVQECGAPMRRITSRGRDACSAR